MEKHAFAPERYSLSLCCDLSLHVQRRELRSFLHRRYWACAATSHARTRTGARGRRQTRTQDTEFISPLSLRHHKQQGNCKAADSPLRIPNERGRGGREGGRGEGGSGRLNGALKEGVPNWQSSVSITMTAVTATRETLQPPQIENTMRVHLF